MITKSDTLIALINNQKLEDSSYINPTDVINDVSFSDELYSKIPKNIDTRKYRQQEISNTTFKIVDICGFLSSLNYCETIDRIGLDSSRLMIVKIESESNQTLHVTLELEEVLNYTKSLINPEIHYNNEFVFLNLTANKTKLIHKSMDNPIYKQYIEDSNVTELSTNQIKKGKIYKIEKIKAKSGSEIYYDYAVNIGEIFIPVFEMNEYNKMVTKKYTKTNIIYYGILSELNELTKEKINNQIIERFISSNKLIYSVYNEFPILVKYLKTNLNRFYEHIPEKYFPKQSDKLRTIGIEELPENNLFDYNIQEMTTLLDSMVQNNTEYMNQFLEQNHKNKIKLNPTIVELLKNILTKIKYFKQTTYSDDTVVTELFKNSYYGLYANYIMYYTICSKLLVNKQLTNVLINDSLIDLLENNLEKLLKNYN